MHKYSMQMRLKKSEKFGLLFNLILSILYVWYLYRTVLLNLRHSFLSEGGDGSKNYFTYLYHILYEKGWHFTGMNYPWGEHISFTDNQPLFAFPLSYLQSTFHFSINTLVGLMNGFIVFSFIISSYFICKLFIKLNVQPILAALFAMCITFMAPNFYRVFGHFGLSYTFNIALTFYWLYQYHQTTQKKYILFLFLLNFFIAFMHMYNLLLSMIIILFYMFAFFIFEKENWKKKARYLMPLFSTIFFSFLLVKIILFFTDPIKDRPVAPWGILHYITTLRDFCTSEFSQIGKMFSLLFNGYYSTQLDESYSYVGIIPLFYLLFILFNFIFYITKKSRDLLYTPLLKSEKYLVFIAFFSFLLAMGFPFVNGFEFILEYISTLKQFRSIGRISIISYYSLSIACVIRIGFIVNQFIQNKKYIQVFYVVFPILLLWCIEIFSYSKYSQNRLDKTDQNFNYFFHDFEVDKNNHLQTKLDTNFQCILGLPLFAIGSEKVSKDDDSGFSGDLYNISLRTGLPIVNCMMSRTSWTQSFEMMRLSGGIFANKKYFTKSINNKNILLILLDEAYLNEGEKSILQFADHIKHEGRVTYYNLNWQKMITLQNSYIDSLNNEEISSFNVKDINIFQNHFDNENTDKVFFGEGAKNISKMDSVILMDTTLQVKEKTTFEFSVWNYINTNDYRMPHFVIELFDNDGNKIDEKIARTQNANDIEDFWFRTSLEFDIDTNIKRIKIKCNNVDNKPSIALDEFLLKPLSAFCASESEDKKYRMYNNHKVKK